jgi:hypothetical protein
LLRSSLFGVDHSNIKLNARFGLQALGASRSSLKTHQTAKMLHHILAFIQNSGMRALRLPFLKDSRLASFNFEVFNFDNGNYRK